MNLGKSFYFSGSQPLPPENVNACKALWSREDEMLQEHQLVLLLVSFWQVRTSKKAKKNGECTVTSITRLWLHCTVMREERETDQITGKGVKKISKIKACELLHVLLLKHSGTNSNQPFRCFKNIMSIFPSSPTQCLALLCGLCPPSWCIRNIYSPLLSSFVNCNIRSVQSDADSEVSIKHSNHDRSSLLCIKELVIISHV